ncbi:hypothetical protein BAUCODRAFT_125144 [Baudoinia panamericana UAMH 10762]|uniref:Major facilitator superfamily (MFS) profile domain-containing protein n=1 Tax=Baudoinia panamericana (strain UAMH 10762) TaxID=717646 RepID=M2LGP6_BAUPA|nr:uncharacterized protein BAUCODRAFT_125144 [Baudoinia panamericana UAMH 10762]EMC93272.1 hypothetical protein BAUCODRAFT_125144 [Baudoinia panamericana UAMH 10762]
MAEKDIVSTEPEGRDSKKLDYEEAVIATDKEHSLTLSQALKAYPKAIMWSVLLSTAVVMEGYDTLLVRSYLASPSFVNTFGNTGSAADGTLAITASWQSAVANGAYIGEILGLAVTGILCDRFGNKAVMTGATVMMIAFIFISFFGTSLPVQLVGQILCGIPWGAYQTITTVYAAEVLPINLRGYLTSYVNLCWVIGQFIGSGVLVGVETRTDVWGWKIPYAVQWVWPLPIIAVCLLCPESPTWLVKHTKLAEAERAVARLQSPNHSAIVPTPQETVALLHKTDAIEKHITEGSSYFECFRSVNLRRTEIATVTWAVQQMAGPVLQTYATYFFIQAGLASSEAFNMTLGLYAIAFVGTVLSWPLIHRFGRRTIFLGGLFGIFVSLMIVGFIGIAPQSDSGASWAAGAFLLVFTFIYDSTIGPLTYVIVPEVSSSRLRHKTTVIARNVYNITCIWTGVLTPYMLNPAAWNWGAKAGFFWAGMTALCILWTWFRLPETKGLTFAEIDTLFEQRVPARRFKKTDVDIGRVLEST